MRVSGLGDKTAGGCHPPSAAVPRRRTVLSPRGSTVHHRDAAAVGDELVAMPLGVGGPCSRATCPMTSAQWASPRCAQPLDVHRIPLSSSRRRVGGLLRRLAAAAGYPFHHESIATVLALVQNVTTRRRRTPTTLSYCSRRTMFENTSRSVTMHAYSSIRRSRVPHIQFCTEWSWRIRLFLTALRVGFDAATAPFTRSGPYLVLINHRYLHPPSLPPSTGSHIRGLVPHSTGPST